MHHKKGRKKHQQEPRGKRGNTVDGPETQKIVLKLHNAEFC